jgi:hypothetical protein
MSQVPFRLNLWIACGSCDLEESMFIFYLIV